MPALMTAERRTGIRLTVSRGSVAMSLRWAQGIGAVNRQDGEEAFAPALCALIPAQSLGRAAPVASLPH